MTRSRCTRRAVIAAAGSAIAAGTATGWYAGKQAVGTESAPDPDVGPSQRRIAPDAVTDRDRETIYPLATYNNRTGRYDVTMPVNVRFDLTDSEYDMAAIEEPLGVRTGWTQIVAAVGSYWPHSDAKPPEVWDSELDGLVSPVANYRKPIGPPAEELCYHVYFWPVRIGDELAGVAAQAHKDVGSVRDHVGTDFAEAVTELTSLYETEGWAVVDADFDPGVDAGLGEFWGPTGDRIVMPPAS